MAQAVGVFNNTTNLALPHHEGCEVECLGINLRHRSAIQRLHYKIKGIQYDSGYIVRLG